MWGGNVGYCSLLASRLVGASGSVLAIEASPATCEALARNIRLNRAANVRAVHVAAAESAGTVRMFRAPETNVGMSSLLGGEGFVEEGVVRAEPLHALLSLDDIQKARLIKVDVEGLEVAVILGLLPALADVRHDLEVIVEVGGGSGDGAPSAVEAAGRIIPLMASQGFNAYRIVNDYRPQAYVATARRARPRRVRSAALVTQECDLIFSRKTKKWL